MERNDILKKALEEYGEEPQLRMVIEECSELIKAVCKYFRQEPDLRKTAIENIIEETADVQIMLDQIRLLFGDTKEIENKKLKRLAERLKTDD